MSIVREWMSSGVLYAFWALSFALTAAPQQAFNVIPPAAGLVAGYAAAVIGMGIGSVWISFVLALICGTAFSVVCHVLIVSPLLKSRDPGRAILLGTLGVLGITQALIALWRSAELVSLREMADARPIFEYMFSKTGIWVVDGPLIVVVLAVVWAMLRTTNIGTLYRGICENREASLFYRLPVARLDLYAAAAAGLVASIAGILTAGGRAISPDSGISFAIWGIAGAVIGGRKDIRTAYLGGLVLGLIEVAVLRYFPSAVEDTLIGLLLVAILLLRPDGLFRPSVRRV